MTDSLLMMDPFVSHFDEEKATDAATRLLRQAGGHMTRLELIKLLYFAEREATERHNRPICGGRYFSMDHGPVLSEVYDLIKGTQLSTVWAARIETDGDDVILREDCPPSAVSQAELDVLDAIYGEWGSQTLDDILKHAHQDLTEWTDPHGSSSLIEPVSFLEAVGKTEQEISDIAAEVREENYFYQLFRG